MLRAINLTCESRINPLGLDSARPRFSWQLSAAESVLQSAYRIMVFQEDDTVPFWDSGRVNSKSSVLVPYDGPALRPRTRYYWQVCIWDQKGRDSLYSERAWWETGLMKPSGFIADWITTPGKVNQEPLMEVFPGTPVAAGGYVTVSDAPGLGVDINEELAKKFPAKNTVTKWTQVRNLDGSIQTP